MSIDGIGQIGFPVTPNQARDIIEKAKRAPFGKGSQTLLDTSVRSAWEIDAAKLSFNNEEWETTLAEIINDLKKGLGIEDQSVTASLYKLLLYETGDFFLPHQDSEKEKGMFGTLVVGLLSSHTGGEMVIRFDGREQKVDFAPATSSYKIPYAAFYADCEHEIKPITSGYRICLVYNLLQSEDSPTINSSQFHDQAKQMTFSLESWEEFFEWRPKVILLGHQYTPSNFSLSHLKLHDRLRVDALKQAADRAGYLSPLALVTLHQMGSLEGDNYHYYDNRRQSRYYEEEEEEEPTTGTMGEIYEEYIMIEYWDESEIPGLGVLPIRKEDIITEIEIGKGDPIEQEEEGYTGNAGMTIQYWYHYGALILWPKSEHLNILLNRPVPVRLQWLEYYLQNWSNEELMAKDYTRRLLTKFSTDIAGEESRYQQIDFSAIATAFVQLEDETLFKQMGKELLPSIFTDVKVENWIVLIQHFDYKIFYPIFQKVAKKNDLFTLRHLLDVLKALDSLETENLKAFVLDFIKQIPDYLTGIQLYKFEKTLAHYFIEHYNEDKETITAIIGNIISLSHHKEKEKIWVEDVLEGLSKSMSRLYLNEVLIPTLLSLKYSKWYLTKALYEICIQKLKTRTAIKPSPPINWKRDTPTTKQNQDLWKMLHPFLNSPDQQVFDYQKNQSYRSAMEMAINRVEIDLRMETIKKRRPYTLRLIKTQASYERMLKEWEEDMNFLKQLMETRPTN